MININNLSEVSDEKLKQLMIVTVKAKTKPKKKKSNLKSHIIEGSRPIKKSLQ